MPHNAFGKLGEGRLWLVAHTVAICIQLWKLPLQETSFVYDHDELVTAGVADVSASTAHDPLVKLRRLDDVVVHDLKLLPDLVDTHLNQCPMRAA